MKKIFLVFVGLILLSFGVIAEQGEGTIGGGVIVNESTTECVDPYVYIDHTARAWEPNDQTIYTASLYGSEGENKHGVLRWDVPLRQNYAFTGETLKYFIVIEESSGANDIDDVYVRVGADRVGRCLEVDEFQDISAFIGPNGKLESYDSNKMKSYICTFIIQNGWTGQTRTRFEVDACNGANTVISQEADVVFMNPSLGVAVTGAVDFGQVVPGTTSLSNSVYIRNAAQGGSGVMMDMYVSSADYFTDPSNEDAICGQGNGIKYDNFYYYATKGSMNSGANNNLYPGLGESALGLCQAGQDEFTQMPSHSGEISDMCRIINHDEYGSLLAQGSEMSMTFKLEVPEPCQGSFTDGEFYLVGRVV